MTWQVVSVNIIREVSADHLSNIDLSTSVVHAPGYTIFNNKLRDAPATDKMWRARLFSRWPSRMERSTGGHACSFRFCSFQEATEDALFMTALRSRCGHYIFALWFLSFYLAFFLA